MKTIVTISTPVGSGAIGIIRMSGDEALKIASKIFVTKKLDSFINATPNFMYYGTITTKTIKDSILAVYFKGPYSYTGEDIVEFQCHGGMRILEEILKECLNQGASVADKGEFTKRAFLNGKVTLSDAEGIIDMINAESIAQINAGYKLSKGNITKEINTIQDNVINIISELEASLDYPDEMEDEAKSDGYKVVNSCINDLEKLLNTADVGGYIKKGISIAIVGIANVGKSSLLNKFVGKERAIVTDIAGTTRDSIEENIEVDGFLLRLIDTAGIRETNDVVESIGVERSIEAAKESDIILFMSESGRDFTEEEKEIYDKILSYKKEIIIVYNKCDKTQPLSSQQGKFISAKKGIGVDQLKKDIVNLLINKKVDASSTLITNQRHAEAIKCALDSLKVALDGIEINPIECTLIDLRKAYVYLGEITGNSANEDIIDRIFSKFCLGK